MTFTVLKSDGQDGTGCLDDLNGHALGLASPEIEILLIAAQRQGADETFPIIRWDDPVFDFGWTEAIEESRDAVLIESSNTYLLK